MKQKILTDEAIGTLIDSKIKSSVSWYNSRLSLERESVIHYYNGDKPHRQKEGASSYISNDVYDSVEGMKGQLLETFASGFEIVKFDPQNPQDIESCRIATQYTDYVVFRQNDGYQIFNDVIHDGLTARVGVVKVWWEEDCEYEDEEFHDLPEDHVTAMAGLDEVHDLDATHDPDTGLYAGTLTRKIDKGQVRIEVMNPEEFSIESEAKCLAQNGEYFTVHRSIKTIAELERQGFDVKKLKDYNIDDSEDLDIMPERLARFWDFETGVSLKADDSQAERRHVLVSECYLRMVRDPDEREKLYKVVRVGNQTLECEEVDSIPFLAFAPLPIPHSFYGNNFAKKVMPAQNVRTTLTRQIIDHANITNNPRYLVVRGGVTNPRELLDNRLGGLVNVTRPDAVQPMPQYGLNPFVFQALQMIGDNNDKTTGISSLSQGLNKDAISSQNSQGMVNDLVNLSQTRQKVIARNFANNFLVPLYLKVYQLVLENEKKQNIVELAGNWIPIDPTQWKSRKSATVSFHLGYGEQDREAAERLQLAGTIMQDPEAAHFFQADGKYKYICDIFKLKGIANFNDYLTPPQKIPPPQPDPFKQQEIQNETTKAQATMIMAQAHVKKNEDHAQIEQVKLSLTQMQDKFNNMVAAKSERRKDHEAANKIDVSQREIHMAETAPQEDVKEIIAPHG